VSCPCEALPRGPRLDAIAQAPRSVLPPPPRSIQLMTNNPFKVRCLKSLGVSVTRVVPISVIPHRFNQQYLLTKAQRMSHALPAVVNAKLLSRRDKAQARQGVMGRWRFGQASVEAAIRALLEGQSVVLMGDEDGDSPAGADLVLAAGRAQPASMQALSRLTTGITYVLLEPQRLAGAGVLELRAGVDYRAGGSGSGGRAVASGLGPLEKAATVRALADPAVAWDAFRSPGHVFPLAADGPVGARRAVAFKLMQLAGLAPAAVVSELMDSERIDIASPSEAKEVAKQHNLVITHVVDVMNFLISENLLR
jgi:3,4-dihydroxy-2-butanone 4-phosphate synthase